MSRCLEPRQPLIYGVRLPSPIHWQSRLNYKNRVLPQRMRPMRGRAHNTHHHSARSVQRLNRLFATACRFLRIHSRHRKHRERIRCASNAIFSNESIGLIRSYAALVAAVLVVAVLVVAFAGRALCARSAVIIILFFYPIVRSSRTGLIR